MAEEIRNMEDILGDIKKVMDTLNSLLVEIYKRGYRDGIEGTMEVISKMGESAAEKENA